VAPPAVVGVQDPDNRTRGCEGARRAPAMAEATPPALVAHGGSPAFFSTTPDAATAATAEPSRSKLRAKPTEAFDAADGPQAGADLSDLVHSVMPTKLDAGEADVPGIVNSMDGAETTGADTVAPQAPSKLSKVGMLLGSKAAGSFKWTGLSQSKTTRLTIANAKDGLMGKMTEVDVRPAEAGDAHAEETAGAAPVLADATPEDGAAAEADPPKDEADANDGTVMFQNEVEGEVVMKDEVKVHHKTVEELEDEAEALARKHRRGCCGIVFVPYDDLPDLPATNPCKMETDNQIRRICLNLAVNSYLQVLWPMASIVHFILALPEIQQSIFLCDKFSPDELAQLQAEYEVSCGIELPFYHHFLFLAIYWSELIIKVTGFGFSGAKFSYWTFDVYNKLDFIATLAYPLEIASSLVTDNTFSLRALRLFRLLLPISQLWIFSDLEIIFHAIASALLPMITVLALIFFVFLLLGIMGMSLFGEGSFRRRCVWADDMTVKLPEALCWRDDNAGLSDGGSCGPFQLCVDRMNPNKNFSHFDNFVGALVTLYQTFTADGQYTILWAALQSAPKWQPLTYAYFIALAIFMGHVLINVFISVFANIFTQSRVRFQLRNAERLKQAETALQAIEDGTSTSRSGSSLSSFGSSGSSHSSSGSSHSSSSQSRSSYSGSESKSRYLDSKSTAAHFSLEQLVRHIKTKEVDPLLQTYMLWAFRNPVYRTFTFLIIFAQALALALDGSLCIYFDGQKDCWIDDTLVTLVNQLNIYFMFDFLVQVLCDGSLPNHFENGENLFNFIVTIITSIGVIGDLFGLDSRSTAWLRGFAILRLLRGCKYGVLNPAWLMLVKSMGAVIPIINLTIFNTVVSFAFYTLGRVLFEDTLTAVNFRSNFSSISRGYMLLFQLMTGDSWGSLMYEGMSMFCAVPGAEDCDQLYSAVAAIFYITYLFYGQYVFITMFLAVILESFTVTEFMSTGPAEQGEPMLTKDDCPRVVAEYHMLPVEMVNKAQLHRAWTLLSDGSRVSRLRLINFYKMNDSRTMWRLSKSCGLIYMRQVFRQTILFPCRRMSCLQPYPGDKDYTAEMSTNAVEISFEEALKEVAHSRSDQIRDFLAEIVHREMTSDVIMVAMQLGLVSDLDTIDLRNTPPVTALKILRDPAISKRLNITGVFDNVIQETIFGYEKRGEEGGEAPIFFLGYGAKDFEARKFRERCNKIIFAVSVAIADSPLFSGLVMATIVLSTVMLCLETPAVGILEKQTRYVTERVIFLAEVVCTAVFALEALSKIFAFGFNAPKSVEHKAYLQSNSNWLDLLVLVLAILQMTSVGEAMGTGTGKILRAVRVLRPLRLLTRSEGLKKILDAMVVSIKPISFAVVFLLVVCTIFAVIGMAFFKRRFDFCTDSSLDGSQIDPDRNIGQGKYECFGAFTSVKPEKGGILLPRAWIQPGFGQHFDTFPSAVLLLFRCITKKWVQYYVSAQDAPWLPDEQPVPGQNYVIASIYFHSFIMIGSFFSLNLFISFICDAFYSIQGDEQLEELQWMSVQQMIREHWPKEPIYPPSNIISKFLRKMLASTWYKGFSAWCLMVNVIFMSTAHEGQSEFYAAILEIQNTVFFAQMCLEAAFNLVSVGPVLYVKESGNRFDLFLIAGTAITMVFSGEFRTLSQVVRILRLFKFGRALSQDKTISNVFETVSVSIRQVVHIVTVLAVMLMMFAVVAVQLYGNVKNQNRVGVQVNYKNFPNSLSSIFQLMIGDQWHQVQDDCMLTYPSCTPDIYDPNDPKVLLYASDCGSFSTAVVFYPALLVCANYIVLNLFMGMIMNNFAYINCKDSNGVLEPADFVKMSDTWVSKFDPKGTGTIKLENVYCFMIEIGEPLGFFGTEENVGRYLCVREELKQKMEIEAQNPARVYSQFYYWMKDKEDEIYSEAFEFFRKHQESMKKAENTLEVAEHHLAATKRHFGVHEDEGAEREWVHDIASSEEVLFPRVKESRHEVDVGDEAQACDNGEEILDLDENSDANSGVGNGADDDPKDGNVGFGLTHPVHVHGASMGLRSGIRQQAWIAGGRMGEDRGENEYGEWSAQRDTELGQARRAVEEARARLLEAKMSAQKYATIRVPLWGKVLTFCRRAIELLTPKEERIEVKPGHVRYLDVMNAMLHWNKRRNIVPAYLLEERREQDDRIILEVAFQIVQAVLLGGALRRRRRKAKALANQRLKKAMLASKRLGMTFAATHHLMANKDLDKLKAMQDLAASSESVQKYIHDPQCRQQRLAFAKIAYYGIACGHEMAALATESGADCGPQGVFGLDDSQLEMVLLHPVLMDYAAHVKLIEDIKSLLDNGQLPLMMLATQVLNIQWNEEVHKMPLHDLKSLVEEPNVQTVMSNFEGNDKNKGKKRLHNTDIVPGGPGGQELVELLDESILEEWVQVKTKIKEKEQENEKLNQILEDAQQRMFELREEYESLVSAAAKAKEVRVPVFACLSLFRSEACT
jgi:hypothetical protein